MAKKLMKLYVWEKVLWDYSSGMIVALAPEVTDLGWVNAKPKLWHVHGGG